MSKVQVHRGLFEGRSRTQDPEQGELLEQRRCRTNTEVVATSYSGSRHADVRSLDEQDSRWMMKRRSSRRNTGPSQPEKENLPILVY
jgi:hypothetical protein